MDVNAGVIMMAAGIAGMVICMVILCILPKVFEKQRKRMLEEIEKEI